MLKCAQRELAMRRNVYPRLVGGKRMTQHKADEEIFWMARIVNFLQNQRK